VKSVFREQKEEKRIKASELGAEEKRAVMLSSLGYGS
jgi:hypothetical protein